MGHELAATLCALSRELGRQIGLIIDRRGKTEYVIAGTPSEIVIPSLSRLRTGAGRLRGLRLVHTHLNNEPLSRDDLTDLAMLRLDMVAAVGVSDKGRPANLYMAHINPGGVSDEAYVKLPTVRFDANALSFGEFIQGLEAELARVDTRAEERGELRAILAHISNLPRREAGERMNELEELARTERIVAVDKVVYRGQTHPKSLLGSGRMKELVINSMAKNADMILFDQELSPAQTRWISDLTDMPVLDRTQLILRIFARRAFSKDGKLRVELARLKYALPRLGAKDDALSRIRGGIGMRGPGETTVEVARRRIKDRIQGLKERIDKLGHGREQRRALRKRSGIPQVAVIGYTNAGKSTLLNLLTKSDVLVEDKLFATLDPTSRRIRFPKNLEVVFSDTVGFIRDLPADLLDAFRSTLEELKDADLLLHLVDVSAPDFKHSLEAVEKVLASLELERIPRKIVLNKIDLADPETVKNEAARYDAIGISAATGEGTDRLTREIIKEISGIKAEAADNGGEGRGGSLAESGMDSARRRGRVDDSDS